MGFKIDLTGKKFNKLKVIRYSHTTNRKCYWDCLCDCGNRTRVNASNLKTGAVKSCGCLFKDKTRNGFKDLTGQKINRLKFLKYLRPHRSGKSIWLVRCDCGKEFEVQGCDVLSGNTKSCGCYISEITANRNKTHNLSNTNKRLYGIWKKLKTRCFNENDKLYHFYGERGITACDEWKNDFKAFYDWAMANGYKDDLTIDRIDVNGNYEPSNCRWANKITQANNTRTNVFVEYKGEKLTIAELSRKYNLSYKTTYNRIRNLHWSVDKAVETPIL